MGHIVRKFPIDTKSFSIDLPTYAYILSVGCIGGSPYAWVQTYDSPFCTPRRIWVVTEGGDVPDESRFVGSIEFKGEMYHYFDSALVPVDDKLREICRDIDNLDDRICHIRNPDRDY